MKLSDKSPKNLFLETFLSDFTNTIFKTVLGDKVMKKFLPKYFAGWNNNVDLAKWSVLICNAL